MLYTYNLTLADTIPYMNSSDYKDRFIGEYWQTKIRYDKLHDMTVRYEAGKLNFTPSCPLDLFKEQKKYMGMYLNKLEIRAILEEIDLTKPLKVNSSSEFVTGTSIMGDTDQLSIDDYTLTTSTHTDGYAEASDEKDEDFTFEEMCKYFEVGEKVIHEIFGVGKIKGIWYDLDENPRLVVDITWDNGATGTLDSSDPNQKKILSELIHG